MIFFEARQTIWGACFLPPARGSRGDTRRPMNPTMKILSGAFLILLLTTLAAAQGAATGDLHVLVRDQRGSVVTNATVTAREQAKAFERSTTENVDGEYRLLSLPPGRYTLTVSAPGFASIEAKDQDVTVGQMRTLPITLSVAGTQEIVTVSSEAELVETQRTSSTDTITQQRIDNLPINGRNYINFALTDSRLARDDAPSIGAAPTSGLNMSGQRARANLVNVDGADAVDNSVNGVRSTVSQEAVQEFQIITNGYAAEYGRASGGVVNIVTRSGTDSFHGTAFGYLRNRKIQAVNPFSTEKNPAYTRVQSGFTLSGPLKKDKTFYFFSFESTRRHETGFSSIGANNFGLTPLAVPGVGTFQVTPAQAEFFAANAGALALPPTDPRYQFLASYLFATGASAAVATTGAQPAAV